MHSASSGRTALIPPLRRLQHHGANALDGDTPHINQACRRLAHSHLLAILPMTRRTALAKTTGQLLHGTTGRAAGGLASGTNRSCQPLAIFLAPGPLGPLVQLGTAGPGTWDFLRVCFVPPYVHWCNRSCQVFYGAMPCGGVARSSAAVDGGFCSLFTACGWLPLACRFYLHCAAWDPGGSPSGRCGLDSTFGGRCGKIWVCALCLDGIWWSMRS